jgi:transcriptional regulator with XRE-family HTH domain
MSPLMILRRLMSDIGFNQYELAERLGVSQGTVSRWLKGTDPRGSHRDAIINLAREQGLLEASDTLMIPIVGRVGADPSGTILYAEGQGTGDMALIPPGADSSCVAVEVAGHSMGLRAPDGSLIFYADRRDPPQEDMLGHLVIVGLPSGEVLLKRMLRGAEPGRFDLESVMGNIRQNERVEWAAHIMSIVPPYQAQKIIRRGRP